MCGRRQADSAAGRQIFTKIENLAQCDTENEVANFQN